MRAIRKALRGSVFQRSDSVNLTDNRSVDETIRVGTWIRSARSITSRGGQHKKGMAGDIVGTRNRCLGMARKLLTDARETSYVILSSLLTAECSTIELPGS